MSTPAPPTAEAAPPSVQQPDAPGPDSIIEADFDDTDSALASDSGTAYTGSLASSVLDYKYENGRRYHAFREGQYLWPNDESEQDRLDLFHHIFRLNLGGALFRAPIGSQVHRVLDFGTGTGIWAIDFADEFPSAEVIGTDLSPIQPNWVPPNCKFEVDDVESEWTHAPFDFIHSRAMGGSISNYPRLYKQAYDNLQPGGWIEVQEFEAWVRSDTEGMMEKATCITEWQTIIDETTAKIGKRLRVAADQKQHLIDAGFEDVSEDVYKLPIGGWPKDPRLKELGRYEQVQMIDAVEPASLALFTRILEWDRVRTEALLAGVRNEFKNTSFHFYCKLYFVYGRKPLAPSSSA
ncbi:MAG: hypothetical protein M1832_005518 [Thelocarpon impressellum]|nr:MAG: hypothetical protein M1832_005518 [Thelocarpon impressellum]